ncbi:uncharacterized protein [Leptinotarsa decemlineata]|uniref:uncharacterized protein n=1 Tax=Leptinotarsa decemlineata TaxID=7539 RepID=UPI003D305C7C
MLRTTFLLVSLTLAVIQAGEGDEDCDKLGTILYEDISCKPVMKEGRKCPVKYDCHFDAKDNSCMFKGRSLSVGEHLDNDVTYDTCNVGCFCRIPEKFTCAVLDCPEWLGLPIQPGCYRKYEVDKCCSVGQNCPTKTEHFGECEVDGTKYMEGEKFYPKNTCLKCICPKNFTGKYEEPYCRRQSCAVQIRDSDKIERNCAPYYGTSNDSPICCPSLWICPTPTDKITVVNPKVEKNPDLTCKFGEKTLQLGEGLFTKVDYYGTINEAKCECILPPWLTCRKVEAAAATE